MNPPQKRTGKHYPAHINPEHVPDNVGYDPRGSGRWFYRKRIGKNRGKDIRLGNGSATIGELHNAVERIERGEESTFRGLSLAFRDSDAWGELARSTQVDYEKCHHAICDRLTRAGYKLGDIPLDAWTTGNIRRYRDARKKQSLSRARKEVAYIKRVFAWGMEYEYCKVNPAKDVSLRGLAVARTHYPQDADYYAALNIAPLNIALLAHLAYLTGRRRTDLVTLKRQSLWPDGIFFEESKTDKASLVQWSDELDHLVELIKQCAGMSLWLFPASDSPGEHYRLAALDTAWQRVRKGLSALGMVPFQFKDIRAKHATDLEAIGGDATDNLLHSDRRVAVVHYLRKPKTVRSLR